MPEHPKSPIASGPVKKRRKIQVACDACRNRKARCDGIKPTCGSCSRRREQCIYHVSSSLAINTNEYIESLVQRVAELEGDLERLRESPAVANRSSQERNTESPISASNLCDSQNEAIHITSPCELVHEKHSPRSGCPFLPALSPVDAMGANAPVGESPHTDDKFFGSSSALSFMRQVDNAIPHDVEKHASAAAKSASTTSNEWHLFGANAHSIAAENFSLFPRRFSDYLISVYWQKVHHLYPFLHKPTFMRAYDGLWASTSSEDVPQRPGLGLGGSKTSGPASLVFHCALNTMLALGIQFSSLPVAERDKLSSLCLEKATNLLHLNLFDDGSISVVQTLLLLTLYLQSTTFPNKCWAAIGSACRLAQGLGLHIDDNRSQNCFEHLELEIRKRLWHGCVMLDMVVSMTLGRPAMLYQDTRIALPAAMEDEDELQIESSVSNQIPAVVFFVEAIKLYKILGRILLHVYNRNEQYNEKPEPRDGFADFDSLIELDSELVQFADQLPEGLRWPRPTVEFNLARNAVLSQQSHVLHVRYLHLRILLYRPTFAEFCRLDGLNPGRRSSSPDHAATRPLAICWSFARCASLICVQTAIDLIEVTNEYAGSEATGAWWYNMFYTRTAAMVVLLASVCAHVRDSIGSGKLEAARYKCRDTLLNKLPQTLAVKSCLETLDALHRRALGFCAPNPETSLVATAATFVHGIGSTGIPHGSFEQDGDLFNVEGIGVQAQDFQPDVVFGQMNFFGSGMFPDSAFDVASGAPLL